jgi:hypothetical protein
MYTDVYALEVSGNNIFAGAAVGGAWRRPLNEIIPVELSSFSVETGINYVTLKWSTATEINNKGFDLERLSVSKWENIGFVAGFGTTTEPKSYLFKDNNVSSGTYSYRLKQIDFDGSFNYSNIIQVSVHTPLHFSLSQNYPNPFNPATKIKFSVPEDGNAKITVYNSIGQRIAQLINRFVKAGSYEINFDASDLPSGVYIYQLQTGSFMDTKKMILLR